MRRIIDNRHSPEKKRPHIGHYGHLRKAYLEGYRPDLYTGLSLVNSSMSIAQRLKPPPEALKAQDPIKWVGLMNACKAQAEEIVKFELIYN